MIGCVLWMWTKLTTRQEIKALGPMNVRLRDIEITLLKDRKKRGWTDSRILMTVGLIITLISALFN